AAPLWSWVILQRDDRITAAPTTIPPRGDREIELTRYNAAGSLDPSFGSGGIAAPPLPGLQVARDVTIQPDGKIVVAGALVGNQTPNNFQVERFNTNGSLDTTFGTVGGATSTG